jgi:hypothetical protein
VFHARDFMSLLGKLRTLSWMSEKGRQAQAQSHTHHVIYSTGEAQNCGIMTSELFISNDWIDGDQSQFEILAFRAVSMLWYVVGRLDHRLLKLPNVEVDNVSWMAEQWWRSARTGDSRRFEVHLELVASPCEGKKTFYAAKLVALGHVIWVRAE